MFLVTLHRSGPQWDASKPLEEQSGWPEHATFMDKEVVKSIVDLIKQARP